jgi:hypothetical protein
MSSREMNSSEIRHVCARQAGEPVWLLARSEGGWIAECGIPGCAWQTSHDHPEAADDAAAGHALAAHPPEGIGEDR